MQLLKPTVAAAGDVEDGGSQSDEVNPRTIPVTAAPWDLAPDADGWLVDSGRVGEAQLRGYAADLSHGVFLASGLEWNGIHQTWRDIAGEGLRIPSKQLLCVLGR